MQLKVPYRPVNACIINKESLSWKPSVIFSYPLRYQASDWCEIFFYFRKITISSWSHFTICRFACVGPFTSTLLDLGCC